MSSNILHLGDPVTHFWMTRAVARIMGVNLSEAMAEGALSAKAYSDMVTTCRKCPLVAECQHWLATEAVPQNAAFEGCPNRCTLERLQ